MVNMVFTVHHYISREGHDKVEVALSRGEVGIWERASRLSETGP